ncbi:CVNH [Aspergillus sp. HF37]|nr:CVNH [Aspergillus sp. HF37]
MSFVETANDLYLEDDHVLVGQLQGDDGELCDASIDLNEVIGNNEGSFEWEGQNFSEYARDVSFSIEDDSTPMLRAVLGVREDEWNESEINLAESIQNYRGRFVFGQIEEEEEAGSGSD